MTRMSQALVARHWLAIATALAAGGAQASGDETAEGRRLFTQAEPPCALCHTLEDAGAEGAIGPNLNELRPDAARVAKALRNGIGPMPSFRDKLSDQQIETLAHYVARVTGAGW